MSEDKPTTFAGMWKAYKRAVIQVSSPEANIEDCQSAFLAGAVSYMTLLKLGVAPDEEFLAFLAGALSYARLTARGLAPLDELEDIVEERLRRTGR